MPRCCRRVGIGSSVSVLHTFVVPFDAVHVQAAMSEIYSSQDLVWASQPYKSASCADSAVDGSAVSQSFHRASPNRSVGFCAAKARVDLTVNCVTTIYHTFCRRQSEVSVVIGPQNQTCDKCCLVANRDCSPSPSHQTPNCRRPGCVWYGVVWVQCAAAAGVLNELFCCCLQAVAVAGQHARAGARESLRNTRSMSVPSDWRSAHCID